MAQQSIRWLHLSDFHIGQDAYGQGKIFQYILDHVTARQVPLDLIFVTGDIAYSGQIDQYQTFLKKFVAPMKKITGSAVWFMVPGNHDVDRQQVKRIDRNGILEDKLQVFEPTENGLGERGCLLLGVRHYHEKLKYPKGWLASKQGYFTWRQSFHGVTVGVVGVNTAWLSKDENDKTQLTPGKPLLEAGLQEIQDCPIKIVLGHHPIDWWVASDQEPIKALFRQYNVLYLHGHRHQSSMDRDPEFLSLQAGSAFQARDSAQWKNRILWGELHLDKSLVELTPYSWVAQHQAWTVDSAAYHPRHQQSGYQGWVFDLPVKIIIPAAEAIDKPAQRPKTKTKQPTQNPYSCTVPGNHFVGRETLLEDVGRTLHNNGSVALIGGRRIGKTSLLLQLQQQLGTQLPAYHPIIQYLSLQELGHVSPANVFKAMDQALLADLDIECWALPQEEAPNTYFTRRLEAAAPQLDAQYGRDWLFVLMVDEIDVIGKKMSADVSEGLFQNLRHLFMVHPLRHRLRLVVSGCHGMEGLIAASSPFNFLTDLHLDPLTEEAALSLMAQMGNRLTLDAKKQLLDLTGRHPCLLQDLLAYLFEQEGDITQAQLVAAQKAFLVQHGKAIFRNWMQYFTPTEQAVYQVLAKTGATCTSGVIQQSLPEVTVGACEDALAVLGYHGVVEHVEGQDFSDLFRFCGTLFRDWVHSHQPQPSPVTQRKRPTLPIGNSDFQRIIREGYFYIDKSLLIQEICDENHQVILIPRPRRFGKTVNMHMLNAFFARSEDNTRALFEHLAIHQYPEYMQHQGQYPVIFLTFKDIKQTDWRSCLNKTKDLISEAFKQHVAVRPSLEQWEADFERIIQCQGKQEHYEVALQRLTQYLYRHYGKRAIILIDEYDQPITTAHEYGYYDEAIAFFRNLLSACLKDNETYLEKGVLTGILRIAKESIFSGLNNLGVFSVLKPEFSDKFGLTETEVTTALATFDLSDSQKIVDEWFNGYRFGHRRMYNPWSIIQFLNTQVVGDYWVSTSKNDLIQDLITQGDDSVQTGIATLLNRGEIIATLDERVAYAEVESKPEAIWSLLTLTGYLSAESAVDKGAHVYRLKIPNEELRGFFHTFVHRDRPQLNSANKPPVVQATVVVLTAIPVEYKAVLAHLDADSVQEVIHPQGTVYEQGDYATPGGQRLRVAVAEIGAGNAGAALESERAVQFFQPDILLFVGVAGGLKDVERGDVVVSTKIYGYESGKANTQLMPRPDVGQSTYALVQRAKADAKKEHWRARLPASERALNPQVIVAPIAAGEKVVASTRSETVQFLRQQYGDAVAVEMEGRGFLQAVQANRQVEALVIRGISDLINQKSASDGAGFQDKAAKTAAAFAFEVLGNYYRA